MNYTPEEDSRMDWLNHFDHNKNKNMTSTKTLINFWNILWKKKWSKFSLDKFAVFIKKWNNEYMNSYDFNQAFYEWIKLQY